jgi:ubiquinone/menaquinone biosynthesis C-methylase UbiE
LLRPGTLILDIGSRSEKIRADAISLDIEKSVRPDICASAEYLPFRAESFDYISMLEVIEHLDNEQLDKALADCKRVGDYLVISTPNCDSKVWSWIVWPLWSHTIGREWIGAHKQFFGKGSVEELMEKEFHMKILEKNYSRWNLLILVRTNPLQQQIAKKAEIEVQPEIGTRRRNAR